MVLGEMEWTHHTNAYSKEVERRSRLDITSVSKVEYRISWSNFPVQIRFFPDSSLMCINIPCREFVSMTVKSETGLIHAFPSPAFH